MHLPAIALSRGLSAVAWILVGTAHAQPRYDFVLINSLNANPLAGETRLSDVNDHGLVCGVTTVDNVIGYPGIVWSQASGTTRVSVSSPESISNNGLVVGIGNVYNVLTGQTFSPPNLPGTYRSPHFGDVNDAGVAVGSISITSGSDSAGILTIPYIWDAVGGARTISVPNAKRLYRINNAGVALGWMNDLVTQGPFFVDLETNAYTALTSVLPANFGVGYPGASDINDSGEIIGSRAGTFPVYQYGYVYSPTTGFRILPFPGAGYQQYLQPTSINNAGTIVGNISTVLASQHVFVYTAADGLIDLNTGSLIAGMPAGYRLYTAAKINNEGWIAGFGHTAAGQITGFVLRARASACRADFNADGSLNPDDLADYISAFFAVPPGFGADFNADGNTDPDDLADYIAAFFAGCA